MSNPISGPTQDTDTDDVSTHDTGEGSKHSKRSKAVSDSNLTRSGCAASTGAQAGGSSPGTTGAVNEPPHAEEIGAQAQHQQDSMQTAQVPGRVPCASLDSAQHSTGSTHGPAAGQQTTTQLQQGQARAASASTQLEASGELAAVSGSLDHGSQVQRPSRLQAVNHQQQSAGGLNTFGAEGGRQDACSDYHTAGSGHMSASSCSVVTTLVTETASGDVIADIRGCTSEQLG